MSKLNTLISSAIFKIKKPDHQESEIDDTNIREVIKYCRKEIADSHDSGIMPSPKYFEQAAVLSRKEQKYSNEIAICEMYISLVKQYAADKNLSKNEFRETILPHCEPLYKRMHNAKSMLSKAGNAQGPI